MKPKIMLIVLFNLWLLTIAPASAQDPTTLDFTYKLSQSTAAYQFWTTTPGQRVFKDDAVPGQTDSEVRVFAAQNEFEPFQVVVKPAASGSVAVDIGDFGSGITTEIHQVKYVYIDQATDSLGQTGDYPDPLWPIEKGDSVTVTANENTAFWFTLYVPQGVPVGDYTANVQIGGQSIPVRLHVFGFAISTEPHVKSQMNFSHNTILNKYSVPGTSTEYWMYVDMMKQFFLDHRLTPKSALWPGGVTSSSGGTAYPFIDYDCDTGQLSDPHGIWGFESPAQKYLDGDAMRDNTGFPSFMAATFVHNDPSDDQRPATWCEQTRTASDWLQNPDSAYNTAWFDYIGDLETYLDNQGYLDKAYYYMANEPQDQADYDAVAWFSQELKQAAPDFKLMVSEPPRPEIYDHPTHTGAKIDIWLPVLNQYDPDESHERARTYNEETWVYFLHGTRPPYFNPITLDHPGVESKLIGWFIWKYRIRGLAYYSFNYWGDNPWTDPMAYGQNGNRFMFYPPSESNKAIAYGSNNHRLVPSIRLELMRDSLEDYEYLYVLAGNSQPEVDAANTADSQADKIITGLTGYTRDSEFIYNLRRLIGLKNGGEIATIPDITPPAKHPRAEGEPGNYYINFQNPAGQPAADPLIVNGHEYMKIGWADYDETAGYGWYSPPEAHWMAHYASSGPNELQRSIIYSDWGRRATFEFDLPNGLYRVTASVGWPGRSYSHNYIDIEGVNFVNDEVSDPFIVRTKEVTVRDNKLTLVMGVPANNEYTMLNYLDIVGAEAKATISPDSLAFPENEPFRYHLGYEAGEIAHTVQISHTVPTPLSIAAGGTFTVTASRSPSPVVSGQLVNWTVPLTAQEEITLTIEMTGSGGGYLTGRAVFSGTGLIEKDIGILIYTDQAYLPTIMK